MASTQHGGIKARAQKGFEDGANYDKYRPSYSASATEELLQQCRVSGRKHAKILDLAAGSGKFTEVLAGRPEEYGIIAVEPHNGMRKVLEEKRLPRTIVQSGKADAIPLADESVDAVTVAQVGCPYYLCFSVNPLPSKLELNARRPSTGSQMSHLSKKFIGCSVHMVFSGLSGILSTTMHRRRAIHRLLGRRKCKTSHGLFRTRRLDSDIRNGRKYSRTKASQLRSL